MSFQIPLTLNDLEKHVSYVVDKESIEEHLPDTLSAYRNIGLKVIDEHFHIFYSILKYFEFINVKNRDDAWRLIIKVLQEFPSSVMKLTRLQDCMDGEVDQNDLEMLRCSLENNLKRAVYIGVQFSNNFETSISTAASKSVQLTVKKKGGRSNKSVQGTSITKVTHLEWSMEREQLLYSLYEIISADLAKLWRPSVVDDAFLRAIISLCFRYIESAEIFKIKTLRESIFQLLALLMSKYNLLEDIQLKLISQLENNEPLANHLAGFLIMCVNSYQMPSIIPSILQIVGCTDPEEAFVSSICKNYSLFLTSLTKLQPSLMLSNISYVIPLLDDKNYTMRNAILVILGDVVVDSAERADREDNIELYITYLDIIETHCCDINAFVRSRSLQILNNIVANNLLPLQRQIQVLTTVVQRLYDVSSQVRKNAVEVLTSLLLRNPYLPKLPVEELKNVYATETAKLAKMREDGQDAKDESEEREDLIKHVRLYWRDIEEDIDAVIGDILEEQALAENDEDEADDIDDNCDIDEICKLIFELLDDKETLNIGVKQFLAAKRTWSSEKRFQMEEPKKPTTTFNKRASVDTDSSADSDREDDEYSKCIEREEEEDAKKNGSEQLSIKQITLKCIQNFFIICKTQYGMDEMNASTLDSEGDSGELTVKEAFLKQRTLVHFIENSMKFAEQLDLAIPIITHFIYSKVSTDVLEAISFFTACYEFGLPQAVMAVSHILNLIWSKSISPLLIYAHYQEDPIKKAVVNSYKRLYLTCEKKTERGTKIGIAMNLIDLMKRSKVGEFDSLEKLICELISSKHIETDVLNVMWDFFTCRIPDSTQQDANAALIIISMAASVLPDIIRVNFDLLIKEGLGDRASNNLMIVVNTCRALNKYEVRGNNIYRLETNHILFEKLTDILIRTFEQEDIKYWILACEYSVEVIYKLAEHPDIICEKFILTLRKKLQIIETDELCGYATIDSSQCIENICQLIRLITLVGTVAHSEMVHVDVTVQVEMKRRARVREEYEKIKKSQKQDDSDSDDMDVGGPANDDIISEKISHITENVLLNENSLLGTLRPLLSEICNKPMIFNDLRLQSAAVLALAKFMIVSPEYCGNNLQLLFTLLEKSQTKIIRGNVMICLDDLAFRFPNLIEPWTSSLYARLRDDSPFVRQKTLMVLTHLILKDMIKVKGQISEVAICTIDADKYIAGLSRNFFTELSLKGNTIYNVISDIISHLSDPDRGVEEPDFKTILKYLFTFIQKDRQSESLVVKLCQRFTMTKLKRQWRDISFCLAQLSYNEKTFTKLLENSNCYMEKINEEPIILSNLQLIVKTIKKSMNSALKLLAQEFEEKFNSGESDVPVASQRNLKVPKTPKTSRVSRSTRNAKAPKTLTKSQMKTQKKKKTTSCVKPKRLKFIASSDDDDEEDYDDDDDDDEDMEDDDDEDFV